VSGIDQTARAVASACAEEMVVPRQKIVAIVDDDPGFLEAVGRLVRARGFEVRSLPSAEAFLGSAARREADCLLLDIQLGGMSGLDLRNQLAASGCAMPVIFMTALEEEGVRQQALDAGCVEYLRKPVPSHRLFAAIEKAIG
jgi:FixJ family two-component response regulator